MCDWLPIVKRLMHNFVSDNFQWKLNFIVTESLKITALDLRDSGNQCLKSLRPQTISWIIVNWISGNIFRWHLNQIFKQENVFESAVCKMANIRPQPQCVEHHFNIIMLKQSTQPLRTIPSVHTNNYEYGLWFLVFCCVFITVDLPKSSRAISLEWGSLRYQDYNTEELGYVFHIKPGKTNDAKT